MTILGVSKGNKRRFGDPPTMAGFLFCGKLLSRKMASCKMVV